MRHVLSAGGSAGGSARRRSGSRRPAGRAGYCYGAGVGAGRHAETLEARRLLSLTGLPGQFEYTDNNAVDNTPGAGTGVSPAKSPLPDDWANVYKTVSTGGDFDNALARTFVSDPPAGDTSYFFGGGSKDVRDINEWGHSPGDVAPDKNDITDAFAAAYVVDTDGNAATPAELVFTFGADKFDASGSNQLGFWFFQNTITQNAATGGFNGVHDVGDTLILTDFTIGGRVANIKVYKWVGSGGSDGVLDFVPSAGNAAAFVNDTTTETAPWPYTDKDGNHDFAPDTFFEGAINMTALGLAGCFNSFLAESRSSGSSLTAQLKDFVLGDFELCDANISIAPDATNEVGTNHVFTVSVTKQDEDTGFVDGPAAGVPVIVSIANTNGAAASFNDNVDSDGDGNPTNDTVVTTGAGGTATVTVNSPTAGITTARATATVTLDGGDESKTVTTDGTSGNSGPAVKRWVDAFIRIAADDTNEVGQPHTFTATVFEDTGDGVDADGDGSTFDPAGGETVTIALANSNGASATPSGPFTGTTNSAGQFSATFTSNSAGVVTGTASSSVSVGGLSLARQTNGSGRNSSGAVKRFVDAFIRIAPDDTNEVGQSHTFVATVFEDAGDGVDSDGDGSTFDPAPGEAVIITLANSNGASASPAGPFTGTTNAAGQFSATFTSASAGLVTGHASSNVSVGGLSLARQTNGSGRNSGDAVKRFVDAFVRIAPDDTNEVGQPHTFVVSVFEDGGDGVDSDGDGSTFDPAGGESVNVTLTGSNGAVPNASTPLSGTTNAAGQFSVTFTSASAGLVTGHASANVAVGGLSLARQTNGSGNNGSDAVKRFVDAYITIAPDDTNEVGQPHTFTATVFEDNGDGLDSDGDGSTFDPAAGESVTITLANANGAAASPSGPFSGTTNAAGQFSATFTSATAGLVTGHASSNVAVGGLSLARQTNGTGNNGSDAVKRFVDAYVTIGPDDTNEVGDPHTFVVSVFEDSGDGVDADGDGSTFDPASGESVNVTLTGSNGAVPAASTPLSGTTNAAGQFAVTFTSDTAGVVAGHAAATVSVGGLTLARQTNGTGNNGSDAVKRFVDAYITIAPDDTNEVGQPHTFTATVFEDNGDGVDSDGDGSTFDPAAGETLTIALAGSNGAGATPAGPFTGATNAAGQFSATFTSATAGLITGTASANVSVGGLSLARSTNGTGRNSSPAVKRFVDAFIRIAADDTNEVGQPHTFTATVFEDTGDGVDADGDGSTFDPAGGETVTITLANSNGGVATPAGPFTGTTNAAGQFSATFTSATAGLVTGTASSNVSVGGLSLARSTNGSGNNSSGAVKRFVDAFIRISPDDTNEVGQPHTFTATVFEDSGDGVDSDGDGSTFDPAAGETVTITLANSNGASASPAGPFTGTTNAAGQFSATFTSASAGLVTGHASSNVSVGGLSLARQTNGSGRNSGDAVKRFVDAFIRISPDDTNGITEPHTFTATVFEDSGDGVDSDGDGSTFDPAAGETVTITLTNGGSAVATPAGPFTGTTNAAGQFSATFTSNTAGTVTGHASSNVSVGGLSLARSTNGTGRNSGNAVKTFVDGTLRWLKHDDAGNLLGGAVFEVIRTHTFNSATGQFDDTADVAIGVGSPPRVTDDTDGVNGPAGAGLDQDGTGGEFQLNGLVLGRYTIHETAAPPGFLLDPDTETVNLTVSNPSNADNTAGDVVPVFVNTPFGGQLAHTQSTCDDFHNGNIAGTPLELVQVNYSVRSGAISQIDPGVLFYWTQVKASGPTFTVELRQTENHPALNQFFGLQSLSLFNANCTASGLPKTVTVNGGVVTIVVSGAPAAPTTFILGAKYSPKNLVGLTAPSSPTTVHYDFATFLNGTFVEKDANGLNLVRKSDTAMSIASLFGDSPVTVSQIRKARIEGARALLA